MTVRAEDISSADRDAVEFDPNLETIVICDIDGTIAQRQGRGPFEFTKVASDVPKTSVVAILRQVSLAYGNGYRVVFMSGRPEECREATIEWIDEHTGVWGYELHMRASGDFRKDSIVKRELFDKHIRGKYNVLAVFDDRDQVVKMWREELGLTCFQVAEGAF